MNKLYDEVKTALRRDIEREIYKSGEKIPSESQLTQSLGVSAITVRRALRDLVMEGLLIGKQGIGMFVADNRCVVRSLRSDFRDSMADQIRRAGLEPKITKLAISEVLGQKVILEILKVRSGSVLHCVEKLILADDRPISVERDYLPSRLASLNDDLASTYLIPLLISRGIRIDHIDYRVEGGSVSAEDASLLELAPGMPILKVHYTPIGAGAVPVATGMSISRADRFAYEFRVNVGLKAPKKSRARSKRRARM
jgi:GntR family transcriptional regulator